MLSRTTMQESTVQALNQLNHTFYEAIAAEWSEHRTRPWPGFERVLTAMPEQEATRRRVLDVGAGDGRFAAYLARSGRTDVEYVGIDQSERLLSRARARDLGAAYRFVQADVLADDFEAALPDRLCSLVSLFGVMHHLPGLGSRKRLLGILARHMESSAILAMTFWRLPEDPRFARRVLSWPRYNESAQLRIPEEDLEPGDTLLRWGNAGAPPRYCHFASDAEIAELVASTGLAVRERFRADRLNDYVVLQRQA